ncbi:hypothetical protein [Nocardia sp. CS682]|uniref:hypothetical protein n=1 Tax=Nocardia sp. CS682 TaxID=1047172 RepID=UPI001074FAD6|nr:hypothetical protein [Nocardia sp. CS682]
MTDERNIDNLDTVPHSDAWQQLDERLARRSHGDPDAVWERIRQALGGPPVAPAVSAESRTETVDDSAPTDLSNGDRADVRGPGPSVFDRAPQANWADTA